MLPSKGMFLDCGPIDQPEGTWRANTRNIIFSKSKGGGFPEEGFDKTLIPDINLVFNTSMLTNISGGGYNWTLGSSPTFTISGAFGTDLLSGKYPFINGKEYTIQYNFTASITGSAIIAHIGFYKDGVGIVYDQILTNISSGTYSSNFVYTLTFEADYFFIYFTGASTSCTITVTTLQVINDIILTQPIGSTSLPDGSSVIYSAGDISRIGILNSSDVYTDLLITRLGFSTNFPIRASEFSYNYLKQRIITWTDGNTYPGLLNIDNLPFTLDSNKDLAIPLEINNLYTFPQFSIPIPIPVVNDSGGSVRTGTHHLIIAYENLDGTRTNYSPTLTTTYITEDTIGVGFKKFDGAVPDTLSGKSISYNLTNVDTRFDKIVMIIVSRINSQVIINEIKKIDIKNSNMTITYNGNEPTISLTIGEALTPRAYYIKSQSITQLNNILYHGGLETDDLIDYQSYANQIRINYRTELINDITNLSTSHKNNYKEGFPHGEVGCFYIALLQKNGTWSRMFHIPGRPALSGETLQSSIATGQGLTAKVFQIEDTTNKTGSGATTNMGYWEEDEVYPDNFPTLAGQKVRHHVFPTIRKCKAQHYNGTSGYGINKLDILGIDVSNVVIPNNIKDKVDKWAIFYVKKDITNSINLGVDLLLFGAYPANDNTIKRTTAGNWHIEFEEGSGDKNFQYLRYDVIRNHIFDLLRNKPSLSPAYIDLELKLTRNNLNTNYDETTRVGGWISRSGKNSGQMNGITIDYTEPTQTTTSIISSQTIYRVNQHRYVPNGISDGDIENFNGEEYLHLEINNAYSNALLTPNFMWANSSGQNTDTVILGNSDREESFLYSLRQIKSNIHSLLDNSNIVKANALIDKNQTFANGIYGGGCFIGYNTLLTSSAQSYTIRNVKEGVLIIRGFIGEGKDNVGLRHEVSGDLSTKYFPKTDARTFFYNPSLDTAAPRFNDLSSITNRTGYNDDYSRQNDLIAVSVFDPSEVLTTDFPYKVIRSGASGANQNSLNSWKTYLAADFYESNRSRGAIENLVGIDDILLIHHKYGLFRTLGRENLSLGSTEVFLGVADIFAQVPKEPMSTKLGYLGNQNIFASFTFKGNYFWCDQSQGKVFTISKDGVKEISAIGMYSFFRDNLRINSSLPNSPIEGESLIAGYDPKYSRILLTKKSNTGGFTLSYSLDYECWTCYHDYVPNLYFNTPRDMYLLKDHIYKANSPTRVAKYFDDTIFSTKIEFVYNQEATRKKLFYNVRWITKVYDTNGAILKNETLTHIQVKTDYQDTGRIILKNHTTFGVSSNMRRLRGEWNFNKFKDANSDPFKKRPIMDNFCSVIFEYDNHENLDLSQNLLYLHLVDCNFRPSEI